eukprot:6175010-Pleurochrysis_carterae.AAC.2
MLRLRSGPKRVITKGLQAPQRQDALSTRSVSALRPGSTTGARSESQHRRLSHPKKECGIVLKELCKSAHASVFADFPVASLDAKTSISRFAMCAPSRASRGLHRQSRAASPARARTNDQTLVHASHRNARALAEIPTHSEPYAGGR